jgi:hypothetical protein
LEEVSSSIGRPLAIALYILNINNNNNNNNNGKNNK